MLGVWLTRLAMAYFALASKETLHPYLCIYAYRLSLNSPLIQVDFNLSGHIQR
jgi:hypothetical protein